MAYQTNDSLLHTGLAHHQAGQLQQAEAMYRQVLARDANHPDALHLLGLIAHAVGRQDIAADLIRRALSFRPGWAEATFNLGLVSKAAGRLDDAIHFFRNAIAAHPKQPEYYVNLAIALREKGDVNGTLAVYQSLSRLNPAHADPHFQIGVLLKDQQQFSQAIASLKAAVHLQPDHADAWLNLGIALHAEEKLDDAVAAYRRVIALQPANAFAYNNLGAALREQENLDDSVAACRRAIAINPAFVEAHVNLASALQELCKFADSEASYRHAIALDPACAEAYANLGGMLQERKQNATAIPLLRQAIALKPNLAEPHGSLGNALRELNQLEQALEESRKALALDPEYGGAWNCIGNIEKDAVNLDLSLDAFRNAVKTEPDDAGFQSNLVMTMNYHPALDPNEIAREHFKWDESHAQPLRGKIQPHANICGEARRLRIGYMSPDFRGHVVSRFTLPLFAAHDRARFEIYCYSVSSSHDEVTMQIVGLVDAFRDLTALTDEQSADLIRDDRIDILVDLAGHTGDNRLKIFALKPAPIQVTYLGYPATTGLQAMDYRISDAWADPPGLTDALHSEKLFRLPRCAWVYQDPQSGAAAVEPAATRAGHITFGSFNNLTKLNDPLIKLWGQILQKVPNARLIIKSAALSNDAIRQRFKAMAIDAGISDQNLQLLGSMPMPEHLKMYQQIDIALDSYPYHGTTTTCESLWMGVPVVTLAGKSHVSRVGVSLLNSISAPELVANSREEYVKIAVDLAGDLTRLCDLHASLRRRMQQSPLADGKGLAEAIEHAFSTMWEKWCEQNH